MLSIAKAPSGLDIHAVPVCYFALQPRPRLRRKLIRIAVRRKTTKETRSLLVT